MNKTKISGITRTSDWVGGSLIGELNPCTYAQLVSLLGEPQYKASYSDESGDGKVSTEWSLKYKGQGFRIYDWKQTSLYEEGMWTPAEFRSNKHAEIAWHVGGNVNGEEFIRLINAAVAKGSRSSAKRRSRMH